MKKTGSLVATIALAVLITASATVMATTNNKTPPAQPSPIISLSEANATTPVVVDKSWHDVANNGSATVANIFSINPNYGHLKLLLKNLSSQPVTVNLEHNDTDKLYFSLKIPGNSSYTWESFDQGYPQSMRAGVYTLAWSGGSAVVNGTVNGEAATQP
ncbi:pilus assembly protein [Cohnella sp. OV330]|uniref:pilus assembly protein n=1 Tax=Cohnella sp. OV330 TaxID=1855288 RepID=UPI001160D5EF|nr:pilus assembly protein [Cohnella sp. OV330]